MTLILWKTIHILFQKNQKNRYRQKSNFIFYRVFCCLVIIHSYSWSLVILLLVLQWLRHPYKLTDIMSHPDNHNVDQMIGYYWSTVCDAGPTLAQGLVFTARVDTMLHYKLSVLHNKTRCWPNTDAMSDQRLRRWTNMKTAFVSRFCWVPPAIPPVPLSFELRSDHMSHANECVRPWWAIKAGDIRYELAIDAYHVQYGQHSNILCHVHRPRRCDWGSYVHLVYILLPIDFEKIT